VFSFFSCFRESPSLWHYDTQQGNSMLIVSLQPGINLPPSQISFVCTGLTIVNVVWEYANGFPMADLPPFTDFSEIFLVTSSNVGVGRSNKLMSCGASMQCNLKASNLKIIPSECVARNKLPALILRSCIFCVEMKFNLIITSRE
jgi:hypothetical protein